MATLLDITADMQALEDLLSKADGDISDPAVAAAIDEWMGEINANFETKVDNYAAFITEYLFRAKGRKAEAERMAKKAKVDANTASSLKQRLQAVFESRNIKKIETARYTVGLRKNGGKIPVEVDETRAENLPPRFQAVAISVNKTAIADALTAGEELKFARFGQRGQSLSIR